MSIFSKPMRTVSRLCLLTISLYAVGLCQGTAGVAVPKAERDLLPYSAGDGKWGYLDERGHVVVPAEFSGVALAEALAERLRNVE